MRKSKKIDIKKIIKQHLIQNSKEYIIFSIVFLIGVFLGVLFTNNMKEEQNTEIMQYFSNFVEKFKNTENIDCIQLLKDNLIQTSIFACLLWFFGTTVIGLPIVFGLIMYRGFCLGYTISVIVNVYGISKGIIFVLVSLVAQNIIFIPAIIAIAVSGFKLYKSILKDRRKENIKLEILRHTAFSFVMFIFLALSSVVEIFISTYGLKKIIKYF